ncbi:hypothetical protein GCM10027403_20250 [Arthrobacter tecti]
MKSVLTVATTCGLALVLSACAGNGQDSANTLNAPAALPEPPPTTEAGPPTTNLKFGEGTPSTPMAEAPAIEDCVVVAAGISSVLLAPLSFIGDEDAETMARLEDQLQHLEAKVPAELKADFAKVADAAESGPPGSGQFDESAFRTALEPVQQWLQKHCNEPAE